MSFIIIVRNLKNKHNREVPDAVIPVKERDKGELLVKELRKDDRKGHFHFSLYRLTTLEDVKNYVEANQT